MGHADANVSRSSRPVNPGVGRASGGSCSTPPVTARPSPLVRVVRPGLDADVTFGPPILTFASGSIRPGAVYLNRIQY